MDCNKYEFQSEIFEAAKAGKSEGEVRKDVCSRRQELQHLAGDNPSINQYKAVILAGVSSIFKDRVLAAKQGPVATAQLELWGLEVSLAGKVVSALSSLSPTSMKELAKVKKALDPINAAPSEAALRSAIELLANNETLLADLTELYGEDEEVDSED